MKLSLPAFGSAIAMGFVSGWRTASGLGFATDFPSVFESGSKSESAIPSACGSEIGSARAFEIVFGSVSLG